MKQRIRTGVVIVAAACLVLRFSHIGWVMNSAVALLCALGVYELYDAVGLSQNKVFLTVSAVAAMLAPMLTMPHYGFVLGVLLPVMVVLFGCIMACVEKLRGFRKWQIVLLAVAVAVCFSSMKQIRLRRFGLYELTLGIFVCMITDSCAYLVGSRFGCHKLAPKVSPGKSVEGAIGGAVLAVMILLPICWLVRASGGPRIHWAAMTVYLLLASVIGQYGDLCMSAVKRVVGIKDYSNLLPGHGGILDRCDSLMLVLPFTYLYCTYLGGIFA